MKLLGPLTRIAALAGLLAVTPLAAMPALAAPADVALIKSYIGAWKGRGQLIGAESESVVCRLTLSEGNADKVNYSGRCSLAGTSLAVNGTLAYSDQNSRYEAAMTSNVTFSGLAVGKKSGDGIIFNLKERNKDEEGNDLTVTAAIALKGKGAAIQVDFNVVFNATGDTLKASVPFTK
ncbi:MAG: hypothetical protein J0I99_09880 [Devosia sp.]|uniref:hypothetical protein n=1 Tax=Devosia sp. TaxID=1871048 RepID=UPI001AD39B79|nr:hypothetical protein [Devosia sp.]MBN9309715.1 hypothetical protein [Devosia sp.]MBN9316036.1 hypothetical protein [Devosia sp.]